MNNFLPEFNLVKFYSTTVESGDPSSSEPLTNLHSEYSVRCELYRLGTIGCYRGNGTDKASALADAMVDVQNSLGLFPIAWDSPVEDADAVVGYTAFGNVVIDSITTEKGFTEYRVIEFPNLKEKPSFPSMEEAMEYCEKRFNYYLSKCVYSNED